MKQEKHNEEKKKKPRAGWSPERRAAHAAKMQQRAADGEGRRGRPRKGSEDASVVGILTFIKHAADSVMKGIREGDITLRTMTRKDALILLAHVDGRGLI